MMDVPSLIWILTITGIVALLVYDFIFHVRRAHLPTLKEAAIWSSAYVGIALCFGLGIAVFGGASSGAEYFAGYLTEKALSVDNLFVFLVIMNSFRVPREDQQKVLLFGIAFALLARTFFILLGAALINTFAWVFYLFGLILLVTAGNMLRPEGTVEKSADNIMIRITRRLFHTTGQYDGDRLFTLKDGKRVLTPMLLVMVAIAGTDILFALDSIPAIFGLTQDVFIVFTANAFALLGLRQLYFLIDGLLNRLIFLSYGLALILAFIGVKLMLHALHENNVPFINDGKPLPVVELGIELSLMVIIGVLGITVLASLLSPHGKARAATAAARRHAANYLDPGYTSDARERNRIFAELLEEEQQIRGTERKHRQPAKVEKELMDLIAEAHKHHDEKNPGKNPLTEDAAPKEDPAPREDNG